MSKNSTLQWDSIVVILSWSQRRPSLFLLHNQDFFHATLLGGRVAVRMVEGLVSALELTSVPMTALFIKFDRV